MGVFSIFTWWKARNYDAKMAARAKGMVRVGAYASVLVAASLAISVNSAKATVGERAVMLGRDIAPFASMLQDTNKMRVNGEALWVSKGVSSESVSQVLDKYEEGCRQGGGSVFQEAYNEAKGNPTSAEPKAKPTKQSKLDVKKLGVFREEDDKDGTVLCIVRGNNTPASPFDALSAFTDTEDLGKLGRLRYAYAHKGANGKVDVLTIWTEDTFKFSALFPSEKTGDVGGRDPVLTSRPPESHRLLSIELVGTPYSAHVYRTLQSAEAVTKHYDDELHERGWMGVGAVIDGAQGIGYTKDGLQVVLHIEREDDGYTSVGIAELGMGQGDELTHIMPSVNGVKATTPQPRPGTVLGGNGGTP
ncbi:MAG: hypothetical protein U0174_10595 [Polyangiaceae bacterium]